jgi:hypothetical protein
MPDVKIIPIITVNESYNFYSFLICPPNRENMQFFQLITDVFSQLNSSVKWRVNWRQNLGHSIAQIEITPFYKDSHTNIKSTDFNHITK